MIQLALRSALSDRAAEGRVAVVDDVAVDERQDQAEAKAALAALGLDGKVLRRARPGRGRRRLPGPSATCPRSSSS